MGPYLVIEIKSNGHDAGQVNVLGPLQLGEGVRVRTLPESPSGWDDLGTGDVITLRDDPDTGNQKFQIAFRDVTFMNRWVIKLGANSGDSGDFTVTASGNIKVENVSIQTFFKLENGKLK